MPIQSSFVARLLQSSLHNFCNDLNLLNRQLEKFQRQAHDLEKLEATLGPDDNRRIFLEIQLEKFLKDAKTLESGIRLMAERGKILSDLPDVCEVLSRGR